MFFSKIFYFESMKTAELSGEGSCLEDFVRSVDEVLCLSSCVGNLCRHDSRY